jgi:hypothetical protein
MATPSSDSSTTPSESILNEKVGLPIINPVAKASAKDPAALLYGSECAANSN